MIGALDCLLDDQAAITARSSTLMIMAAAENVQLKRNERSASAFVAHGTIELPAWLFTYCSSSKALYNSAALGGH